MTRIYDFFFNIYTIIFSLLSFVMSNRVLSGLFALLPLIFIPVNTIISFIIIFLTLLLPILFIPLWIIGFIFVILSAQNWLSIIYYTIFAVFIVFPIIFSAISKLFSKPGF